MVVGAGFKDWDSIRRRASSSFRDLDRDFRVEFRGFGVGILGGDEDDGGGAGFMFVERGSLDVIEMAGKAISLPPSLLSLSLWLVFMQGIYLI